jgi:hypothetical protein
MKSLLLTAFSAVVGFFLMYPLGVLFDHFNWPLFNPWALAHGSFLLAWPLCSAVTLLMISAAYRMRKSRSDKPRPD